MSDDLLSEWENADTGTVDLGQLDQLVIKMVEARAEYEKRKEALKPFSQAMDDAENAVLAALQAAKKSKYFVDGVGSVVKIAKLSYKVPKTIDEKKAVFDYIQETYGETFLLAEVSIHSTRFNAWARKEMEARSKDPMFKIPGVDAPVSTEEIRFTKAKA